MSAANKVKSSSSNKMKGQKKKARTEATSGQAKTDPQMSPDIEVPCDTLTVKIMSLRLFEEDSKHFAIKVTYFEQLILTAIIKPIGAKDEEPTKSIAKGTLNYDPSDYEKMCLFADSPLVVNIQPLRNIEGNISGHTVKSQQSLSYSGSNKSSSFSRHATDISCCNVDILSIFLSDEDKQKMCIKKRMEMMIPQSALHSKSWDTLPLLTMELFVERNPLNVEHHKVLKKANWMKLTVVASYNMYIPYEDQFLYTAASKTPLHSDLNVGLVTYSHGHREPRRFNCTSFFPKWESLRLGGDMFTSGDTKLHCKVEDIQNDFDIDLPYYLHRILPYHTTVWGSFHRSLMLKNCDRWLWKHLRNYKWPIEVHIYGENGGYSFMGFLNLFRLLYPGEHTVRLAVPLYWVNADAMWRECGCELLLTPNEKAPSSSNDRTSPTLTTQKASRATPESPTTVSTSTANQWVTGADDNYAFVVVEVKLGRPLKEIVIPPRILKDELSLMLTKMENDGPHKRECTGRGQLERDWQNTIRSAADALRKVPYYGTTELSTFNRQLSETRTRVELMTSCWQDAAIFVNNNFVVQQYLHSDETYEELVMMAHACLMKSACNILVGTDDDREMHPTLRAARHARQMQDVHHAMELYMQTAVIAYYKKIHQAGQVKKALMYLTIRVSYCETLSRLPHTFLISPLTTRHNAVNNIKIQKFALIGDEQRSGNYWRELSTCLKDIDREWAIVCLNKSVVLNPRHPLTLLSKGAMLYEEDPAAAEPFFTALLAKHPTWKTVWVIASAYYYERELFHLSDTALQYAKLPRPDRSSEALKYPRTWEQELGDWWDYTPLLPGMSIYFDAADLLLRLRAIPSSLLTKIGNASTTPLEVLIYMDCGYCLPSGDPHARLPFIKENLEETLNDISQLAEVCVARSLSESGDSAAYYHLIALCCRLRGQYQEALCHLKLGLEKFGEINYLRSLEAECHHRLGNIPEALETFEKAGSCVGAFSILMSMPGRDPQRSRAVIVDLVRRQPSAYAWFAFSEDWFRRLNLIESDPANKTEADIITEKTIARSCVISGAIQALKIDRYAGRAWALLATLVNPSDRRKHCHYMANICGFKVNEEDMSVEENPSKYSICNQVGVALRECRCEMCVNLLM